MWKCDVKSLFFFWKFYHRYASHQPTSRMICEEFFCYLLDIFIRLCEDELPSGGTETGQCRCRLSDKFTDTMELFNWYKESIFFRIFYLDIFSFCTRKSISDNSLKYTYSMKEMDDRIASFYLDKEIKLWPFFPSKYPSHKWSDEFIGNNTYTSSIIHWHCKTRSSQFP